MADKKKNSKIRTDFSRSWLLTRLRRKSAPPEKVQETEHNPLAW
jgi:hypothetical protein